jgi:hypothetical protein
MDLSKLSAAEKRIFYAAAVATFGGLVALIDNWGIGGTVGFLGALAALVVLLLPQLAPAVKLPAPRSTVLFACGIAAGGGFALGAITYLEYLFDFGRIYSILYDVGLVAAIVLLALTYMDYMAEQKPKAPAA